MKKSLIFMVLMVVGLASNAIAQTGLKGPHAKNNIHREATTGTSIINAPQEHLTGGQAKNRSLRNKNLLNAQSISVNQARITKKGPQAKNYRPAKEL